MKNSCIICYQSKILVLLLIIPFLALSSCDSCNCTEDSLDEIKAFKPDNKYFKSSLVSLHFMMETSPVEEVDTYFQQLILMHELPVNAEGAKDGTYIGATPYDAFDYRHEVKIRIQGGEIVEVDYNEVKKDGKGKQEDEEYCEEMSVTGTTPAIAYPLMEEMILTTQNLMEVDAVSGASYSLHRFRLAMTIALMKAII
jgi:major membrane immunogen (membrane-anchored lipoprotein)